MVPEPAGGESHSFRLVIADPVPLQVQFRTHADIPAQRVEDDIETFVYEQEKKDTGLAETKDQLESAGSIDVDNPMVLELRATAGGTHGGDGGDGGGNAKTAIAAKASCTAADTCPSELSESSYSSDGEGDGENGGTAPMAGMGRGDVVGGGRDWGGRAKDESKAGNASAHSSALGSLTVRRRNEEETYV